MTLQEAIRHAKEKSKTLNGKCAQEHLQLAEWLEKLQSLRKSNNWIPALERLPNNEDVVLVTVMGVQEEFTAMDYYDLEIEAWDCFSNDGEVLAWMPLPEPYHEKEE